MKPFKIVANHFKKEKTHYILSTVGLSCAIMTIFLFSMVSSYYNNSIDDIYPQEENVLIVTEKGIPFYNIVPYGSRLNESPLPARHKRKMHEISKNAFGIQTPMTGDRVPVSQIPLAPARHI